MQKEKRERGRYIFEEIIVESFSDSIKSINLQIQEVLCTTRYIDIKNCWKTRIKRKLENSKRKMSSYVRI